MMQIVNNAQYWMIKPKKAPIMAKIATILASIGKELSIIVLLFDSPDMQNGAAAAVHIA